MMLVVLKLKYFLLLLKLKFVWLTPFVIGSLVYSGSVLVVIFGGFGFLYCDGIVG